jgi:hypothetical protein
MNPVEAQLQEYLKPLFDRTFARTQDPEEVFRIGYLCGMQKAAEIEAESHTGKGRRPKNLESKGRPDK